MQISNKDVKLPGSTRVLSSLQKRPLSESENKIKPWYIGVGTAVTLWLCKRIADALAEQEAKQPVYAYKPTCSYARYVESGRRV